MTVNRLSYTAAGNLPWKLLTAPGAITPDRQIVPYHLQFCPTYRCNANCTWCSCKNVDRGIEMPIEEVEELLTHFAHLGSRAITITGGGEPTIHSHFDRILEMAGALGYKIGLVSNVLRWGAELKALVDSPGILAADKHLTWLRMSVIDTESGRYEVERLARVAKALPHVAIGISFTVSAKVSLKTVEAVAAMAQLTPNITHVRFVTDIVAETVGRAMEEVEERCKEVTDKAIYQRRHEFTPGARECLISKLKPQVGADGYVYPCCGVQYADGSTSQTLDMPPKYRMVHWREYNLDTPRFDGSGCVKCFYSGYNQVLGVLTGKGLEHPEFL